MATRMTSAPAGVTTGVFVEVAPGHAPVPRGAAVRDGGKLSDRMTAHQARGASRAHAVADDRAGSEIDGSVGFDRPSRTAAGDRARRRRAGRGITPANRSDADRPGADGRTGPRSGVVGLVPRRSPMAAGSVCLPAERPYRMGRWARLATTLTVTAVAVLAGWSAFAGSGPSIQDVVVQPGDTVRSIAAQAQPGADVEAVVVQILDLNMLAGQEPLPGQVLQVPVEG